MNPNAYSTEFHGSGPSCYETLIAYWRTVSIFVKMVFIINCIFFTISLIFLSVVKFLTNIPYFTMHQFRIWSLFTTPFATTWVLNVLFGFLSWIPQGSKLELRDGTVRYSIYFMCHTFIIQIIHFLTSLLIGLLYDPILKAASTGIVSLVCAEVAMYCSANPDTHSRLFLIPYNIPSKIFPFILLGVFLVVNLAIKVDILVGVFYGYFLGNIVVSKIKISSETVERWEKLLFFSVLKKFDGKSYNIGFCSVNDIEASKFGDKEHHNTSNFGDESIRHSDARQENKKENSENKKEAEKKPNYDEVEQSKKGEKVNKEETDEHKIKDVKEASIKEDENESYNH